MIKNIALEPCRLIADNKSTSISRNSNNNPIPPLTGSTPGECTLNGFRILSLPSCGVLTLDGIPLVVGQVLTSGEESEILYSQSGCTNATQTFLYQSISDIEGCEDSLAATVTILVSNCEIDWQPTGETRCTSCVHEIQQVDVNFSCSGNSSQYRWIPSGNNSPCTQIVWEDVNEFRCFECEEQRKQLNTNPCNSAIEQWIPYSSGTSCNTIPNFVATHDPAVVRCFNCMEQIQYIDINPCSPSYNSTEWRLYPGGTQCNTTPIWEDAGEIRCRNCQEEKLQTNINPCITVPDQWVINPTGEACNISESWEWTGEEECFEGFKRRRMRNVNPCYTGDQFDWEVTTDSCTCEYSLDINKICNDAEVEIESVHRIDVIEDEDRTLSFIDGTVVFTIDHGEYDYIITIVSNEIMSTININLNCNGLLQ